MARSTKVRISAKLLVASYRKLAMAIRRRRQSKGRPTLSDVLTGEVTKQVMKADQVTFLSGTLITVRMSDAPGRILLIEDDPDVGAAIGARAASSWLQGPLGEHCERSTGAA
jgi:hypothetical protein